jgi:amidase
VAQIGSLDLMAQAALVRRGELTASELTEAAIARIEAVNPRLNAVIRPLFGAARRRACEPLGDGPLAGAPFLLKDGLAALAGVPATSGSRYLAGVVPDRDSELVARYKRAGLVILGKTNLPEMGLMPVTEPHLFGPTKNPWDVTRTPGGSSGGSAAAVAARLVAAAHGNDGGGSIRIPASCCGIFGLKPTRGRITLGPVLGDIMGGLVVEHALTVSVRDSAALLDATAGPSPGDPYYAAPPARPWLDEVAVAPGRLRVGWLTETCFGVGGRPDADAVAAAEDAAALLEDLGHHVEEVRLPFDEAQAAMTFFTLWAAGTAGQIEATALALGRAPRDGELEPTTVQLRELGASVPASRYIVAWTYLQLVTRKIARLLESVDVLLTPTTGEVPLLQGAADREPTLMGRFRRSMRFVPHTYLANVTGLPAMSVPLYWTAGGLPIGGHFMGRYGDEATLFRLAAQLEQARPWALRLPPVCAV